MKPTGPDHHGPTVPLNGTRRPLAVTADDDRGQPILTAPRGTIMLVAALIVIGLATSGTVAAANGTPMWVLALGAVGGAVAGIWGGRQILRLLPGTAPHSATSIDLRLDDDLID